MTMKRSLFFWSAIVVLVSSLWLAFETFAPPRIELPNDQRVVRAQIENFGYYIGRRCGLIGSISKTSEPGRFADTLAAADVRTPEAHLGVPADAPAVSVVKTISYTGSTVMTSGQNVAALAISFRPRVITIKIQRA